eukprot:TRINITY_DN8860_c0_g1_i2.p1 TRINITY_DN8860_c0_g1~~TRINITY_DN8860_c0_g1_i2.p1  ORF type:complete len:877 (+),score=270.16 TRINITY_DN8860_c0_g1_i2:123-2753(+)
MATDDVDEHGANDLCKDALQKHRGQFRSPPRSPSEKSDFGGFSFGSSATQDVAARDTKDGGDRWPVVHNGDDNSAHRMAALADVSDVGERTSRLVEELGMLRRDLRVMRDHNKSRDAAHDDLNQRVRELGSSMDSNAEEQAHSARQLLDAVRDLRTVAESVGQEVYDLKELGDRRERRHEELAARVDELAEVGEIGPSGSRLASFGGSSGSRPGKHLAEEAANGFEGSSYDPTSDLMEALKELRAVAASTGQDVAALKALDSRRDALHEELSHRVEALASSVDDVRQEQGAALLSARGAASTACSSSRQGNATGLSQRLETLEQALSQGAPLEELRQMCAKLEFDAAVSYSACDSLAQRLQQMEQHLEPLLAGDSTGEPRPSSPGDCLAARPPAAADAPQQVRLETLERQLRQAAEQHTKELGELRRSLGDQLQEKLLLEKAAREELREEVQERFRSDRHFVEAKRLQEHFQVYDAVAEERFRSDRHFVEAKRLQERFQVYDAVAEESSRLTASLQALELRLSREVSDLRQQVLALDDRAASLKGQRLCLDMSDSLRSCPGEEKSADWQNWEPTLGSAALPVSLAGAAVLAKAGDKHDCPAAALTSGVLENERLLREKQHKSCQEFLRQAHSSLAKVLKTTAGGRPGTTSSSQGDSALEALKAAHQRRGFGAAKASSSAARLCGPSVEELMVGSKFSVAAASLSRSEDLVSPSSLPDELSSSTAAGGFSSSLGSLPTASASTAVPASESSPIWEASALSDQDAAGLRALLAKAGMGALGGLPKGAASKGEDSSPLSSLFSPGGLLQQPSARSAGQAMESRQPSSVPGNASLPAFRGSSALQALAAQAEASVAAPPRSVSPRAERAFGPALGRRTLG